MGAKRAIHKRASKINVDPSISNYQCRRYVFTSFDVTDDWKNKLIASDEFKDKIAYLVAELEYCPSTQRKHNQGYVRLKNKEWRNTIKKYLPNCYLEKAMGSEIQNIKYCTKDNIDVFKYGVAFKTAETSLNKEEKTIQMLKDILEMSEAEFEAKYPYQYFHHYNKLMAYKLRHQKLKEIWNGDLRDKNYWIWGEAGTGKSKWARRQAPLQRIFKKNLNKWWDGFVEGDYDVVVMDEMNPSKGVLVDQLKDWGDRYPFKGEIKGAATDIDPGTFFLIITANYPIEECFEKEEDKKAIKRRFREVNIKDKNDIFLKTLLDKSILSK